MPVHALDSYYLALTLLVTTVYQLLGFAIACTLQVDKITDLTGVCGDIFVVACMLRAEARDLISSFWASLKACICPTANWWP
jgi:hypothetical protein